jgi:DNA-binding LytR/AlgR family response regulator
MKILIVDDEVPARQRLAAMLAGLDGVTVAGEAGNGREAVEMAEVLRVDAVLMDIAMPVMDGLASARHLARLQPPPSVIFCTAYDEHALAAFEAAAVDYLVKPVRQERLLQALDRARRGRVPSPVAELEPGPTASPQRQRSHLAARMRGNLRLIPIEDVHYLLAEGGEIRIDVNLEPGRLRLRVANPFPTSRAGLENGNRHAQDSIAQRLAYHFGAGARLHRSHDDGAYLCEIELPLP